MMAMRLKDLDPQWSRIYRDFTPETGGVATDDYELIFDCPSCGRPYRILIKFGLGPPNEPQRRWQANVLPDGMQDWLNQLTLTPSIDHTRCGGHGPRHPNCEFHGHIVEGIVS